MLIKATFASFLFAAFVQAGQPPETYDAQDHATNYPAYAPPKTPHHKPPYGPHPKLTYHTYLEPAYPVTWPPHNYSFSPTSFTLIEGADSAVLVEAPATFNTTAHLASWIKATLPPHKPLTHAYVTHGHGDHFFGLQLLQTHYFPGLIVTGTPGTIAHAADQRDPAVFDNFWERFFPGQIPSSNPTFHAVTPESPLYLSGHALIPVQVGQSDTYNSTVLHIPSLSLVVSGDVIYGSCFQYFGDSSTVALQERWLRAIDDVEALKAKTVIPGHHQPHDSFDAGERLRSTRTYIKAWMAEVAASRGSDDLIRRISERFPERIGDFILAYSAQAAFPA